jgi:hypothetical protein
VRQRVGSPDVRGRPALVARLRYLEHRLRADRNARVHPERVGFDRKLVRRVVREPPLISYERERDLIQADVDLMKIIQ